MLYLGSSWSCIPPMCSQRGLWQFNRATEYLGECWIEFLSELSDSSNLMFICEDIVAEKQNANLLFKVFAKLKLAVSGYLFVPHISSCITTTGTQIQSVSNWTWLWLNEDNILQCVVIKTMLTQKKVSTHYFHIGLTWFTPSPSCFCWSLSLVLNKTRVIVITILHVHSKYNWSLVS